MTDKVYSLAKLFDGTGAKPIRTHCDTVSGICTDSRRVHENDLFLCVRGLRHDGHTYAAEAACGGASVVLAERSDLALPDECDLWVCPDARLAEAVVYDNFYDHPAAGMTAVAITGSNGKTSTAYMLRTILAAAGEKTGAITTTGAFAGREEISFANGGTSLADAVGAMTTPDPAVFYGTIAKMRDCGCTHLVYEASSHALDLRKTDAVRPSIAIFTGMDCEHLDYHGTMEAYFAAKSRLFKLLSPHGIRTGICNADDPYAERLMAAHPDVFFRTCTANAERIAECDVTGLYCTCSTAGTSFLYYADDAIFRMRLPIPGRYTMYNAMEAATAARILGVHPMEIRESLTAMEPIPGRMERVPLGNALYTAYIDYAHTPRAMAAVLSTLRALTPSPTRLTVVFGCGGDRDPGKRAAMGRIAATTADSVIVTNDNPRTEDPAKIIADIVSGIPDGTAYTVIPDRTEAITYAVERAIPGEILVFLGKGHEKYEWIGMEKRPFDEKQIIIEAAEHHTGGTI